MDDKLKKPSSRKRDKEARISRVVNQEKSLEEIVFSENEESALNRVVVMDDLMNEAFNSHDKDVNSTMNLLMTKLSHHNNISVLLVCHELYRKGPNSVLLCDQLTRMHLHSVANAQRARKYVCNYLTDEDEKAQYNELFKEHVLSVGDSVNGKRRGSTFVKFSSQSGEDGGIRAGRFLTFNECNHSVVHELSRKKKY